MDTFSLVFKIPPITDIIAFRDAIDEAEAVLNRIGATVISCKATTDEIVQVEPTEAEMAEQKEVCPFCQYPLDRCLCSKVHVPQDPPIANQPPTWLIPPTVHENLTVEPEKPKGRKYLQCGKCNFEEELVFSLIYPGEMTTSCPKCKNVSEKMVITEVPV